MIKFYCSNCNQKLGVPKGNGGGTCKCTKCGESIRIPLLSEEFNENQSNMYKENPSEFSDLGSNFDDDSGFDSNIDIDDIDNHVVEKKLDIQQDNSVLPKWAWCFIGVFGLFFVSFMLWLVALRDTWETDNYAELSQLISDVQNHVSKKDSDNAIIKYDQLYSFIDNRQLKSKYLSEDYALLEIEYLRIKKEILDEKKRQAELARLEAQRKLEAERMEEKRQRDILAEKRRKEKEEKERKIAYANALKAEAIAAKQASIRMAEQREQEKIRKRNARINDGCLTLREVADSYVESLIDNGTLMEAGFIKTEYFKEASGDAEVFYLVKYLTQGGLVRRGQCNIIMKRVDISNEMRLKYVMNNTWSINVVYVDGANVSGFKSVTQFGDIPF